jgi:hypothetical protein
MSKSHHDIIFCVFACPTKEKYINEILKVNATWGSKAKLENYRVLFFVGEESCALQGNDYIHLKNVNNDYMSASFKQNLGLLHIKENFTYDYVYVCGTDTYVNIDYLKQYLKKYNPCDSICIGGHGDYRIINNQKVYYHSGGPGFIISQCALNTISHLLHNMVEDWEDIIYMYSTNPQLITACDLALCFFLTKNGCTMIKDNESFFHCNHLGFPCHPGNRLGVNIVACHNMSLADFDEYTMILNNSTNIGHCSIVA